MQEPRDDTLVSQTRTEMVNRKKIIPPPSSRYKQLPVLFASSSRGCKATLYVISNECPLRTGQGITGFSRGVQRCRELLDASTGHFHHEERKVVFVLDITQEIAGHRISERLARKFAIPLRVLEQLIATTWLGIAIRADAVRADQEPVARAKPCPLGRVCGVPGTEKWTGDWPPLGRTGGAQDRRARAVLRGPGRAPRSQY